MIRVIIRSGALLAIVAAGLVLTVAVDEERRR